MTQTCFSNSDGIFIWLGFYCKKQELGGEVVTAVVTKEVQLTPDNSNLEGPIEKRSSYRELEESSREKGKKQFLLKSEHLNHI